MRSCIISATLLFALLASARAQDGRTDVIRVLAEGKPAAGAKVWLFTPWEKHAEPAALNADAGGKAIAKLTAPGQRVAYIGPRDT